MTLSPGLFVRFSESVTRRRVPTLQIPGQSHSAVNVPSSLLYG